LHFAANVGLLVNRKQLTATLSLAQNKQADGLDVDLRSGADVLMKDFDGDIEAHGM
jgi:hypothetical protein